ncbi:DUF1800 family protein [Phaeodactylibacter sp.]|uniref:DUF1800 family protein n=1 Tax=Phaeodactylibacter sp. TaxID=1940289 RepID=UPI0025D4E6B5|nr:DUF1800 family protein [Phaeodactylibacter sp.]MCI4648405.1 DUF1800 domain-containing protein [Phaeodactylibacter sp.]MCI5091098.1 DUF1800 domain-containing protein [Phaeodactylibacter sp.]
MLRRASFYVTKDRIEAFAGMTAAEAADLLCAIPPLTHPEGPINWLDGTTPWLTTGGYDNGPDAFMNHRQRAVWMWVFNEMLLDHSVRHKMALFWHGIFVTEKDRDWSEFDLFRLFQLYATGNVRELAYKVTQDNKMLRYLNNNTNQKNSPNENYAREFLELFTILKGPVRGTGDYTNYTEEDIVQAARVLTGFKDEGFESKDPETGLATGQPRYNWHDPGNKTFSSAFGNRTIYGATDESDMHRELQEFVDMVFEQKETARAFVRRLYQFFVKDSIDEEVEQDIIEPLSTQLHDADYEVSNVLKVLLSSQHFYDEDDSDSKDNIVGGKIKSPLELFLQAVNLFAANQVGVLNENYEHYDSTARHLLVDQFDPLGFSVYPLSVEGYPGFFKGPNYSKFWFDQSTIAYRFRLPFSLLEGQTVRNNRSLPYQIDLVPFFRDNFTNQEYAEELVRQFLELSLSELPQGDRFDYFLQKLLGDLSPINWMFEWQGYIQSGNDESVAVALRDLFEAVVGAPEFQTF